MKHRMGFNPLSLKSSRRKALIKNMLCALFRHERIRTSLAKAKELRRFAEKLITRARSDSVHNRRVAFRTIRDKAILAKLFIDIGPRFIDRPGGYTRILKLGPRKSDGTEMVWIELVERKKEEPVAKSKKQAEKRPKSRVSAA